MLLDFGVRSFASQEIGHDRWGPRSHPFGRQAESGGTSLDAPRTRHHHGLVTMYEDVLSDAVRASDGGLTGQALVDHVVDTRVRMLSARLGSAPSAYDLLAADIAYDASLIRLCDDIGVATGVADFANPLVERTRIERVLDESCGIDLCALSRSHRQT
jgi:hypothetical protein